MKCFCLLLLTTLLASCSSTYKGINEYELTLFYNNEMYEPVIEKLKSDIIENKDNLLINKLNLSLAYHNSHKYKESNTVLEEIKKDLRWNHILSTKEITLSFFLNDNFKKFQVTEYEQLMVQFYVALNYASMNNWTEALVEMRQLESVFIELGKNKNFSFADKSHLSYLMGVIYEANGKYDEALIDYQRIYKHNKYHPYLSYDLFRTAWLSKQYQKAMKYAEELRVPKNYQEFVKSGKINGMGELIVINQSGLAPVKVDHTYWRNIAIYKKRDTVPDYLEIEIDSVNYGRTYPLMSLNEFSADMQKGQIKTMVAEDMAKSLMKEIVAWSVGAGSGFLGIVAARTIAHSTTSPDYRTWYFLPAEIQIARIQVKTNTKTIKANFNTIESKESRVKISEGKKKLISFKQFNK